MGLKLTPLLILLFIWFTKLLGRDLDEGLLSQGIAHHSRSLLQYSYFAKNGIYYNGGPVSSGGIVVYLVWYGDWSTLTKSQSLVRNFFASLGTNSTAPQQPSVQGWWTIMTEYYGSGPYSAYVLPNITLSSKELNASVLPSGQLLNTSNVEDVLNSSFVAGLTVDSNGLYFVFSAPQADETCSTCATRSFQNFTTNPSIVTHYAWILYPNDSCLNTCTAFTSGGNYVSPNNDKGGDGMVNLAAIMLAALAVDPELSGWRTDSSQFSSDVPFLCQFNFSTTYTNVNNGTYNLYGNGNQTFLISQMYDLDKGKCALQGKQFATPPPPRPPPPQPSPKSPSPPLLNSTQQTTSSNPPPPVSSSGGSSVGIVVGVAVCGVVVILIFFATIIWCCYRKNSRGFAKGGIIQLSDGGLTRQFTLLEIEVATDNFNKSNCLGKGGYGTVYRGTAPDGSLWAVKRAHVKVDESERSKEFDDEVNLIARMSHRNLVCLLGFCREKGEQILVYEFVAGGTLKGRIESQSNQSNGVPPLSFMDRIQIALGSARGLSYLHGYAQEPVIHRDIKSENILLTENLEAKVADFGLSKTVVEGVTHVSTKIAGTIGYMDPEYRGGGKLSTKSDVFSFGVVILELMTGRKPVVKDDEVSGAEEDSESFTTLAKWANSYAQIGRFREIADPAMGADYPYESFQKVIHLAHLCTRWSGKSRPSMEEVVRRLELIREEASGAPSFETGDLNFETDDISEIRSYAASESYTDSSILVSGTFVAPVSSVHGVAR